MPIYLPLSFQPEITDSVVRFVDSEPVLVPTGLSGMPLYRQNQLDLIYDRADVPIFYVPQDVDCITERRFYDDISEKRTPPPISRMAWHAMHYGGY